jgi:hypothetical protein
MHEYDSSIHDSQSKDFSLRVGQLSNVNNYKKWMGMTGQDRELLLTWTGVHAVATKKTANSVVQMPLLNAVSKDSFSIMPMSQGIFTGNGSLEYRRADSLTVRRFCSNIAIKAFADDAQVVDYKLHCDLGGNIEFINLVLGLMNCGSAIPCYLCEVKLETQRTHRRTWFQLPQEFQQDSRNNSRMCKSMKQSQNRGKRRNRTTRLSARSCFQLCLRE